MSDEKLKSYEEFDTDLFSVRGTMGVPHTYCITPKHIEHSPGMYLDVEAAEEKGARCGVAGCQLSYAEHETALAINCKSTDENDLLHEYILSIKEQCEADGYAGFVFVDCSEE